VARRLSRHDVRALVRAALNRHGAQSGEGFERLISSHVLAFDRVRQLMEITSIVFTEKAGDDRDRLRDLYARAVLETKRLRNPERRRAAGACCERRSRDATVHFQSMAAQGFRARSAQSRNASRRVIAIKWSSAQHHKANNSADAGHLSRAARYESFALHVLSAFG